MAFFRQLGVALGLLREPSLAGRWERVGDAFQGCVVEIRNRNGEWAGDIVDLPVKMAAFGWAAGDLKWRRIARRAPFCYGLFDLYKTVNRETGEMAEDYRQAVLPSRS